MRGWRGGSRALSDEGLTVERYLSSESMVCVLVRGKHVQSQLRRTQVLTVEKRVDIF